MTSGNPGFRKGGTLEEIAAAELPPKRPAKPKDFKAALKRAVDGATARGADDWEGAEASDFVGVYAWLHREVYGVEAAELRKEFLAARSAADRMLREEFSGQSRAMIGFVRWAWARERGREQRRASGDGWRLGWRLLYSSRSLLVDYRVEARRSVR